ncbi:hypothetical protein [Streptomyces sp. TP-A0874]|uniref:hypothetical protein n=1 Tax=Streptomyces sp. TP-A0874 TaxID=549819 RepID=UPI000853C72F|nr:hypothetical protein [Streptomyces sp. TP-A0874]
MNEPTPGEQPAKESDPGGRQPAAHPESAVRTADRSAGETPATEVGSGPGPHRTPTGNPEVDAGLERLADAEPLTVEGHLEVYEDVHGRLRETLAALDSHPGPPAPPTPADQDRLRPQELNRRWQ